MVDNDSKNIFSEEKVCNFPDSFIVIPYITDKFKSVLYERIDTLYHYTNLDGLLGIVGNSGE